MTNNIQHFSRCTRCFFVGTCPRHFYPLPERVRAAEYEQHKGASQLEGILEAIADAVLIYDEQGMIRRSNSAAHSRFPIFNTQPLAARAAHLVICDEQDVPLPVEQLPVSRVLRGESLAGTEAADIIEHGRNARLQRKSRFGRECMHIFDMVHTISAYLPINENSFVKSWNNPTKKAGIHESI